MTKQQANLIGIRFIPRINKWEARAAVKGTHYSKTFLNKDDAIFWRMQLLQPTSFVVATCELLFDSWLNNPFGFYSPQTIFIYRQNVRLYLLPEFGSLKPTEIDENLILSFAIKLAETKTVQGKARSLKTVRNIIGTLSTFFEWCCLKNYLQTNPAKEPRVVQNMARFFKHQRLEQKFSTNIKKKALTKEEAKKLILQGYERNFQTGFIIEFLIYTGLRMGEVAALTWGDLEYLETNPQGSASLFVVIQKTMNHRTREVQLNAKCGSNGHVELSNVIANKIVEWHSIAKSLSYSLEKTAALFPLASKNPLEFSKLISNLSMKAGIRHVSAHGLRHTTITFLASSGHSLQVVQKIARHKTADMTTAYFDATQLPVTGVTSSIDKLLA